MATILWVALAPPIAQVDKLTVGGSVAIGNTIVVTINTKAITYTCIGGDTTTKAAAALKALLAASTIPEFVEIAWTTATNTVIGTAATAGIPFTQTSSGTGGATLTTAHTTASTGPADANNAANYSTGALPVNADDLYFENTANSCLYNLGSLSAVSLNSLTIRDTFTGTIGLPKFNTLGYYEYRTQYLAIGGTTLNLASTSGGSSSGGGSGRVKINGTWTTVNVNATGQPLEAGIGSLLMTGTITTANINKGFVGFAQFSGDTCTITTLKMGFMSSQTSDANVRCGIGCTLTTVTRNYGILETNSNITTVTEGPGTHTHYAGTIGTIVGNAGTLFYRSTGTITTGTAYPGFVMDFSQDQQGRTVTNFTLNKGSGWNDPNATVTRSNPIAIKGRLKDISPFDIGANVTVA